MGLPHSIEARRFYRAALQRYDDANLLLNAGRTTGAVYLAGYTVKCMLKALVLAGVTGRLRSKLRGNRAHNLEWLGALFRLNVKTAIPHAITRHLARCSSWSTALRYETEVWKNREATAFFESVKAIVTWADGSM